MTRDYRYICCRFVEFKGKNGDTVRGYIPYVLDEETDEIIKCRMVRNALNALNMGDVVKVNVRFGARFVSYRITDAE